MTMNLDTNQPLPPEGPVVDVRDAGMELSPAYDVGMEGVSFTLQRGELALVRLEHGMPEHPLADVLSGLAGITSGDVRVFGQEWPRLGPDEQARARWRIGRVFAGHGWMSNLDVDENVTLAERYHGRRRVSDILEEAHELARRAGLTDLPDTRPAMTDWNRLRRAEWVRAMLGTPWLCLFERPGRDLTESWLDEFLPMVDALRARGTAVVWLCVDDGEWQAGVNPSLKFTAKGNKLVRVA